MKNKAITVISLTTFILIFSQIIFGQKNEFPKLQQTGNTIADFVPTEWKIGQQIEGDLNGDNIADAVLILQGISPQFINKALPTLDIEIKKKNEETGEIEYFRDYNPSVLVVLIKEDKDYKLSAQNNRIIPLPDGFRKWYSNIVIKNKTLVLKLISIPNSSTFHPWDFNPDKTYKFQLQNSRMVLVEAELNSGKLKYDFLKDKGYFTVTERTKNQLEKVETYKINDLISLESLSEYATDNIFSLGYLHYELRGDDKDKKNLVKIFDGRENIPAFDRPELSEEIEIVEREIRSQEKVIKQLAETDGFKCEAESFRIIEWDNGTFIKTKEKSRKYKVTDPKLPITSYTIQPQNAYLYRLCSSGKAQYATNLGGIVITEKGKIKAHYIFSNVSGFDSIGVLRDINKNGLSEIVLEFNHSINSLNFARTIGIFEVGANLEFTNLGETDFFRRLENQEEDDISYKIFVKKGKTPKFYRETFGSKLEKNEWTKIKELTEFELEKSAKVKLQSILPTVGSYLDLIPPGHPAEISQGKTNELSSFDKIVFEFKDASVSPEYQRNYKIELTKTSAKVVLESYKVLDRETIKISEEQFNKIVKIFQKANLKNRPNLDDDGCSGGTTDIFEFFSNKKSVFKGFVYHCGGDDYGNLVGDSLAVKDALTSLFPKVKAKFRNIE